MQLSERIKKIRILSHLSQLVFSKSLGVSRSHISKIETGAVIPSTQLLKLICKEYRVKEKWLREGKGPVEEGPLTQKKVQEIDTILEGVRYKAAIEHLEFYNDILDNLISKLKTFKWHPIKTDHPDAAKYLEVKKAFQKKLNELQKLSSLLDRKLK